MIMNRYRTTLLLILCAIFLAPATSWGYIGPGAGLGMIGSLLAVVGAVALALAGLVLLPVRLIMKRRRKAVAAQQDQTANDNSPSTD